MTMDLSHLGGAGAPQPSSDGLTVFKGAIDVRLKAMREALGHLCANSLTAGPTDTWGCPPSWPAP
jgi:hypothetical protein